MFILKTELKLYFNRVLLITILIFSVFLPVAGSLGDRLFYGEQIFDTFTVLVIDNDNSSESRLLINALKDFKPETMAVSVIDEGELAFARSAVQNNDAAAIFVIPEGFFASIMTGENENAQLILDGQNAAVSEVIRLFAESVKEQLSAAQAGVYFTLTNAETNEQFERFITEINFSFLSIFLGRSIEVETVSTFGAASKADYYMFSFYVFVMLLIPCIFIQNGNIVKSKAFLPMLLSKGVSISYIFICKLLSVAAVFFVLNLPFLVVVLTKTQAFFTSVTLFALLVLLQTAYCTALIWFFADIKIAGIFVFMAGLFALFFSGGILPPVFLPQAIRSVGLITPNYYLTNLFIDAAGGAFSYANALVVMLFVTLALTAAYIRAKLLAEEA